MTYGKGVLKISLVAPEIAPYKPLLNINMN